jgi:hypothetical protein
LLLRSGRIGSNPGSEFAQPELEGARRRRFHLDVSGNNSVSGSLVQWNGFPLSTTFVSSTQLTALVPAFRTLTWGIAYITVLNPADVPSNALVFTVTGAPPTTVTNSLSPANTVAGSAGFALAIDGVGFDIGTQVLWNGGQILSTIFIGSTQLTALVPASAIALPGSYIRRAQGLR